MSEKDSASPFTLSPSSLFLVSILIIGFYGLLLTQRELAIFYAIMFLIAIIFPVLGFTEFNVGRSVESIIEGEDEQTETMVDAVLFGILGVLAGLIITAIVSRVTYFSIVFFLPFTTGMLDPFTLFQENPFLKLFSKLVFSIIIAFTSGFSEEFGFRGPAFTMATQSVASVTGSNLLAASIVIPLFATPFSAYHIFRYSTELASGNPLPFITLFVMGCVWGVLSYKRGFLTAAMSHGINNSLAALVSCMMEVT